MPNQAELQQQLDKLKEKLYPIGWAYGVGLVINLETIYLNTINAMPGNIIKPSLNILTSMTSLGLMTIIAEILTLGHVKTEEEWLRTQPRGSYTAYLKEFEEHLQSLENRLPMLQYGTYYIGLVQIPLAASYTYAHLSNPVTRNTVNEHIGYCVKMGATVLGKFKNYWWGDNNVPALNQEGTHGHNFNQSLKRLK